jgi:hypothetical protein
MLGPNSEEIKNATTGKTDSEDIMKNLRAQLRFVSLLLLLLVIAILGIALLVARVRVAHAQASPVELEVDAPGMGSLGHLFMIAVPITNHGTLTAANVQITGATLGTATLTSPTTFPVTLGAIESGAGAIFQATFDSKSLVQNTIYSLNITGTYQINEVPFAFTLTLSTGLPPASPGSGVTKTVMVDAEDLSGAPFPYRAPEFGKETNPEGPPTPIGPFVGVAPAQQSMSAQPGPTAGGVRPATDPAVAFLTNEGFGNLVSDTAPGASYDPSEPSGGSSASGVVFVSVNGGAAYHASGTTTFTTGLAPSTIFSGKASNGTTYGFCCDQHVQYVSKIDRFVWLQQLTEGGSATPGAYRLATATPDDITKYNGLTPAWKSWIITPENVGLVHVTQFDFPSMSVGNNYLHISWDDNCPTSPPSGGCKVGREVVRILLSDISSVASGGELPVNYATDPRQSGGCAPGGLFPCMAWATFVTQNTGDTVFWAGHNGNSALRVFSWAEDSATYYWRDVSGLESYNVNLDGGSDHPYPQHIPSNAPSPVLGSSSPCPPPSTQPSCGDTPASRDWLYRKSDDSITGATRSGSNIFFAWNAGPMGNFPQPYIVIVGIDTLADYSVVLQGQIWNDAYAFAFPSLSTNGCTGEVGLSLAEGGGAVYPNHAVGFWGDFLVYLTTTGGVTGSQYGDYVTIRKNYTPDLHGAFFDAFGYALSKARSAGTGTTLAPAEVNLDVRHVVFGRPGACGQ